MRHLFIALLVGLALGAACLPASRRCAPCEPGGCGDGLTCVAVAEGRLCLGAGQGPDSCGATAPDAGSLADAGRPEDAGVADATVVDAGISPCPTSTVADLEWVESKAAGVCFTRTEITVRQFEVCAAAECISPNRYHYWRNNQLECNFERPGVRDLAMNCIDEDGAAGVCAFLGGRLPTRAEWEAEATAGGTRSYPWGEEPPDCTRVVRFGESTGGCDTGLSAEVCSRPAGNSVSGLCDMAGNMWEYTSDMSGANPISCGGSWLWDDEADFFAAGCYNGAGLHSDHGIRCVTDKVR